MIEKILLSLHSPGLLWTGLIIAAITATVVLIRAVKHAAHGFEDEEGFYFDAKPSPGSLGSRPARPSSSSASPFSCQHSRSLSRKNTRRKKSLSGKVLPQIH